jgi:hypothetical protein
MPSFGTLDHERLLARVPRVEDLATVRQESKLVEMLVFAAEIPQEPSQDCVPKALSRALPPYARIEIRKHEDSPWGPFHIASLQIAVRAVDQPMTYATGAFCDNDRVAEYLRLHYGARLKRGAISVERRYAGIEGRVAAEGRLVFDALLEGPEPLAPGEVVALPVLHLAKFEGQLWLIEEEIEHTFAMAEVGATLVRKFDSEAFGEARAVFRNPMPAVFAKSSATYQPVRQIIDPAIPAYMGTRTIKGEAAA